MSYNIHERKVRSMDTNFYLLSFSVNGIKNIKKEIRLNFYKKTVDKSFDPKDFKVKAIYGENGSGKTALITAVQILKQLISEKAYLSDFQNQQFLKNIINKENKELYIETEVLYRRLDDDYINFYVLNYSLVLGLEPDNLYVIKKESLSYKNGNYPNNHYKKIFIINNGNIEFLDFTEKEKEKIDKRTLNLLTSQTMISCFFHQNLIAEISASSNYMHIFYMYVFSYMNNIYLNEQDKHTLYMVQKYLDSPDNIANNKEFRSLLNKHIISYDSISSELIHKTRFHVYKTKIEKLCSFLKIFKPDLQKIIINKKVDGEYYKCSLEMNYGNYNIDYEFESTGIKKLVRLYDCFNNASRGGIVFIDELDSNINDVYFCKLVEYFMYYGKGQLCFTTHNLGPMSVLKENKLSIEFLSNNNVIHTWTSSGNASPENFYKNGMIEDIPFNVDATDFLGLFEEE